MRNKLFVVAGILFAVLVLAFLVGCAGPEGQQGPAGPPGPTGPPGPAGTVVASDLGCTQCHNDTQLIPAKQVQWRESMHATGTAFLRGTSASCAGCHAGQGFSDRISAGLDPDEVTEGVPSPTGQNCRTCHQIHTAFNEDDFALETTEPVSLYATGLDATYDSGDGNLCANCHQPRRTLADFEVTNGMIRINDTHFGPHYGTEAAMFLGVGGSIEGNPGIHYTIVEDSCVTCHLGPNNNHTFEPLLSVCQSCHTGAENFDINGVQTEIEELLAEIEAILEEKGMIEPGTIHTTIVGDFPEEDVQAMWNFLFVHEDQSRGAHNSGYARALLESALETLQQ